MTTIVTTSPELKFATLRRPWQIPSWAPEYTYAQPSFYGTCSAISGVGITSNNCTPNTMPVATSGNGCYCYDPYTQWAGCGNTANGVCRIPIASPLPVVSQPYPVVTPIVPVPISPWTPSIYPPRRCPPGLLC